MKDLELTPPDSPPMKAYVARPKSSATSPGIMVLQEAYGVNSHIREVCDRFADEGFVAIAPDLYHRISAGFEGDYADPAPAIALVKQLSVETLTPDIRTTYAWLQANPKVDATRIAAIGFCMGGKAAFLANTLVPLQASISFYGGGIGTEFLPRAAHQKGPLLLIWGGKDSHIKSAQINAATEALTEADKTFTNVVFSQAGHGFFCDQRADYSAFAATEAWALSLAFLRNHLNLH